MSAVEKRDVILMASHGRRGVSAIVLGSETVKVLTQHDSGRYGPWAKSSSVFAASYFAAS